MRDFQVYVEDIIDAIDSIEEYTEELTYERFVKDKLLSDYSYFLFSNNY